MWKIASWLFSFWVLSAVNTVGVWRCVIGTYLQTTIHFCVITIFLIWRLPFVFMTPPFYTRGHRELIWWFETCLNSLVDINFYVLFQRNLKYICRQITCAQVKVLRNRGLSQTWEEYVKTVTSVFFTNSKWNFLNSVKAKINAVICRTRGSRLP